MILVNLNLCLYSFNSTLTEARDWGSTRFFVVGAWSMIILSTTGKNFFGEVLVAMTGFVVSEPFFMSILDLRAPGYREFDSFKNLSIWGMVEVDTLISGVNHQT